MPPYQDEEYARDEYESYIFDFCKKLRDDLLWKYRKGKKEHKNQKAIDIDCQREVNMEVLDIINYHLIDCVHQKKPLHSSQSSGALKRGENRLKSIQFKQKKKVK